MVAALALAPFLAPLRWQPLVAATTPAAPAASPAVTATPAPALDPRDAPTPYWWPQLEPAAEDRQPLVDRIALYRVGATDTLQSLAERFGITVDTLLGANPFLNPDRLMPGQELLVLPVSGVIHTLAEGETLDAVAARYGVEVAAIQEANGLPDTPTLRAGDRLLIPNAQPPQPAPPVRALPWPAPGTGPTFKQQFIDAAAAAAQETQRRTGVPASVAIAMAINETGWGTSRLARDAHNYFGIKGRVGEGPAGVVWMNTWEVLGGQNLYLREPFRAYHTPEESFLDFGLFLHANPRYRRALSMLDDPRAFVREIAAAGFATDPNYAAKIIRIMDAYNLYQYDLR
ncbi:MAG: glucosaminidase domain-containing protein [Chloroflexi bacterium]|nr:glucosaminidase domain-containing protein [Chloroflexota bacterium]